MELEPQVRISMLCSLGCVQSPNVMCKPTTTVSRVTSHLNGQNSTLEPMESLLAAVCPESREPCRSAAPADQLSPPVPEGPSVLAVCVCVSVPEGPSVLAVCVCARCVLAVCVCKYIRTYRGKPRETPGGC